MTEPEATIYFSSGEDIEHFLDFMITYSASFDYAEHFAIF